MNRAALDSPAGFTEDDGTRHVTYAADVMTADVHDADDADDADDAAETMAERESLAALLRCCLREIAGPRGQVWAAGPYLTFRLGGSLLRVRASGGPALRFEGPAQRLEHGAWRALSLEHLVRLVETELSAEPDAYTGTGTAVNEEFAGQVAGSRAAMAVLVRARAGAVAPEDPWLASEQALVFGHPFHPSPKARGGEGWERYAPEAHASFPLRLLGVREDVLASGGEPGVMDALGEAPAGYVLLPAHPWQLDLLGAEPAGPLADGRLLDLGDAAGLAIPTSSVRTVYEPRIGKCLKFSLNVRITNCVRKNAWYELAAASELSGRLEPVFADLAGRFPGTRWLAEPGYRSAVLGTRLLEGLGVIVRDSPWEVVGPGITPMLAGALAVPGHGAGDQAGRVAGAMAHDPVGWFGAYIGHVAIPVFDAYFRHGVVLEPHLQNVLVGIAADGLPIEAIFRDLEGTKLVIGRHDVSDLPDLVAGAASYDATRGWNRVVYCIMVNHLPEIAATVARTAAHTDAPTKTHDADELLRGLWAEAGVRIARYAAEIGDPLPLSDLLAGAPLPAKANLTARWARSADRDAGYVPISNPFAEVSG
ncbi:IucA/IucC family protein [Sphaerisporangium sp. NPDC051017]|uniref:IucA/IucC family protein n=1 Tax=Sphaerisporangium sp. NPDC051017 TaxID=3154636 RepID=UPI00341DB6E9